MKALLILFAGAALALAGCGAEADSWPPQPAEVRLGEAACASCRMIVSDGRFAAQAHRRTESGVEVLAFDDLGCLVAMSKDDPFDAQGVFVQSFADGRWVRGDAAVFACSKEIASPMGFGFAAFSSRDAAAAEAAKHPGAAVALLSELSCETCETCTAHR